MKTLAADAIRRGETVTYNGSSRPLDVLGGRYLRLTDGTPLARWIRVRDRETGATLLAHPSNLNRSAS